MDRTNIALASGFGLLIPDIAIPLAEQQAA